MPYATEYLLEAARRLQAERDASYAAGGPREASPDAWENLESAVSYAEAHG